MIILISTEQFGFKSSCFGIKHMGYVIDNLMYLRPNVGMVFKIIGFYINENFLNRIKEQWF